ncbi:NERD domain-containing protein [Candidatus Woesearchaeota archaeon]|nr:NERD domain-containing protein [Candidatus Woesearchaeota archaeon]
MIIKGIPGSLKKLYEMLSPHCVEPPDFDDYSPVENIENYVNELIEGRERILPQEDSTFEPCRKGAIGELMLVHGLNNMLKDEHCYLIHSTELPYGKTCRQPDHILIHPDALVVIETKYWSWFRNHEQTKEVQQQLKEGEEALEKLLQKETGMPAERALPIIYDPNYRIDYDLLKKDETYREQRLLRKPEHLVKKMIPEYRRFTTPLTEHHIESYKDVLVKRILRGQDVCTCGTIKIKHIQCSSSQY